MPIAPQMAPMPPQMPGAPPVQFPPHSGAPPNSYPQYIAPQPPVMSQAPPAFRQSSPLQENGHPQVGLTLIIHQLTDLFSITSETIWRK